MVLLDDFLEHYGVGAVPNGVSESPSPVTNWSDVANSSIYCFRRVGDNPLYASADLTKNANLAKLYDMAATKAFNNHLTGCGILALNKIDENAFVYSFDRKTQTLYPEMLTVSHLNSFKECPKFYVNLDENGFIIGVKADVPKEETPTISLAQSDILEHYGVKGMHWGRRRARKRAAQRKKTMFKKAPARLSDAELTRRIKRLELEKKYSELNKPAKSEGKKYVHSILENSGRTVTGAAVGGTAAFFVQRALKTKFGETSSKKVSTDKLIKEAEKFLNKHPKGFN